MIEVLKLLPAAMLIAGYALFGNLPPEKSLRHWTEINSRAYVEVINNTKFTLQIYASAPAVDSLVRFLGLVNECASARFKLPYVDTKVTIRSGDAVKEINVYKPGTYSIEIFAYDESNACHFDTKVVEYVLEFVDPYRWKASPYFRLDDVVTPSTVILADDETVCVLFESLVNVPRQYDKFTCKTKWRTKRN